MKFTVEIGKFRDPQDGSPCTVEMYLDRESLVDYMHELQKLKNPGDHFHLMTPSWGMDGLSEKKVISENDLVHHLKVTLR